jgi:hypothetical protein
MTGPAQPEDSLAEPRVVPIGAALASLRAPFVFALSALSLPNSESLARILPGLHRRPERGLILAGPQDVVCLNEAADPEYLAFLGSMGIGPPPEGIVVARPDGAGADGRTLPERLLAHGPGLATVAELLRSHARAVLFPHFSSPAEHALARALSETSGTPVDVLGADPAVALRLYQKHLVKARAAALGVPVAPGQAVELGRAAQKGFDALRRAAEDMSRDSGRAIIRGTSGSSGSATFLTSANPEDIARTVDAVRDRGDDEVYLVDRFLDVTVSPNVQVFVAGPTAPVSCVSIADQRLSPALGYRGNAFPSLASRLTDLTAASLDLGEWLAQEGFTGLAGFDFIEHRQFGATAWCLAELNPRVNGVTYPSVVMERLNAERAQSHPRIGGFVSAELQVERQSFARFRDRFSRMLFDPARGRGLFPYYVGCLEAGHLSAAFFGGTRAEAAALHDEFVGCTPGS